jgi:DNA sulfur modification protein DndB
MPPIVLPVLRGYSADQPVLLGFAAASVLHRLSFPDVLDETAGTGYQRRIHMPHSLDFRRYIQKDGSTTIPLTFNLRSTNTGAWKLKPGGSGTAQLIVREDAGRILAQVDCQHRLGRIEDLDVYLPFMCFVELSVREELEIFNIINGKARGLSGSLLDYHEVRLASDLSVERPELFIAFYLRDTEESPWYQQLDLGGGNTVGMYRRASLRTMQKAVKRFLGASKALSSGAAPVEVARVVRDYWTAVASVLRNEWAHPRRNLINKGVGIYALMDLLADLWTERRGVTAELTYSYFEASLSDFAGDFDWSNKGPLKGLGGAGGAKAASTLIRAARANARSSNSSSRKRRPPVVENHAHG